MLALLRVYRLYRYPAPTLGGRGEGTDEAEDILLDDGRSLYQNNMPMTSVLNSNKKNLDAGSVNTNVMDSNASMSTPLLLSPDAELFVERDIERYLLSCVLCKYLCPVALQSLILSC